MFNHCNKNTFAATYEFNPVRHLIANKIKTLKTKRKHIHESWKSAIYMYLASFFPRRLKLV